TSVKKKTLDAMSLKQSFLEVENQVDRDEKIFQAYEEGYSQHAIAQCLHLSQAHINRIIKKARGISIT
ncbi:sigma factor-like helix-turn-helix DNA-binding protein, partial [Aliarcobacter cryaerophilus]|uniref:sigma factor-like helix-turn-helix DNA-binding protein n=2 Tax=Aliarcobacter cryaerophilus TaxID=28198 RepID=UPI003DA3DE30